MKEVWSNSWKKILIWACGYVSIIAFAIAGGYAIVKSEDEDLKKTAKTCFIVTLVFLAVDALISIFSAISQGVYSAGFAAFIAWFSFAVLILKIAAYAFFIVMELVNARGEQPAQSKALPEEKVPAEKEEDIPEQK